MTQECDASWTYKNGRSNSSDAFQFLCDEVESMIRGGAHSLIAGNAGSVARLIVAQLAHVHGLVPSRPIGDGELTDGRKE